MNFVCSLTCSEEFKRVNNIIGECEYCKSEKLIGDAKRVDNKDCYFCSEGKRTGKNISKQNCTVYVVHLLLVNNIQI